MSPPIPARTRHSSYQCRAVNSAARMVTAQALGAQLDSSLKNNQALPCSGERSSCRLSGNRVMLSTASTHPCRNEESRPMTASVRDAEMLRLRAQHDTSAWTGY